jgi:hypothetical protein
VKQRYKKKSEKIRIANPADEDQLNTVANEILQSSSEDSGSEYCTDEEDCSSNYTDEGNSGSKYTDQEK